MLNEAGGSARLEPGAEAGRERTARWASALLCAAGLFGAAGVGAAALAAHGKGGPDLAIAAQFFMVHAAAVCALVRPGRRADRAFLAAASLLSLGTVLFCGDLSSFALLGSRLFPMAAPTGGLTLIAGWLAVAAAAVFDRVRNE
ncbi:MAG TPA: DUF423 domain-containing protein [Beijerinckiaceae bacterium]|nr:DUF423 domain-containing protein [Beijerinckiaceae bacterium]